jgi:hypothetical protein
MVKKRKVRALKGSMALSAQAKSVNGGALVFGRVVV